MQGFYESAWHHPAIAWASNGAFLLLGLRKAPREWRAYLFLVALGSMLDAWFTGALAPGKYQSAAIAFVIIGDWRYFYLLSQKALPSLAVAFVAPLLQTLLLPWLHGRWIFACYEAIFLLVALTYDRDKRFTPFILLQYCAWLVADLLLIAGYEWAIVLRLFANCLYYGVFIWFVSARLSAWSPAVTSSS